jgi:hypothetical protein
MWNALERSALRHAFQAYSITHVRTENLPESIRKKAGEIHTWMERVNDSNFTEDAGPGLDDDIVNLYTEIAQESAKSPGASSSSPPSREPVA